MTTKAQRQLMIADWLRDHRVGSQEEVVARLSLAGIAATQATVSRDLLEIGAVKQKRDGSVRYVMPDQVEPGHAAAKLDRLLANVVLRDVVLDHKVDQPPCPLEQFRLEGMFVEDDLEIAGLGRIVVDAAGVENQRHRGVEIGAEPH